MFKTTGLAILALLLIPAAQATEFSQNAPASPATIPARLLTCVLGRATNLDPHRDQKRSEVIYEGSHKFALYLPETQRRTTAPPDPTEPPEPVDPRTKIVVDPDGLTKQVPSRFDRVIDLWPERVEMVTTIAEPVVNLIIVSDISADGKQANLFMTKATDVATLDLKNVYSGSCNVGFDVAGGS
ncbi:hypothetical protein [Novosphingobium sp. MMS21-SN21R]|uniref:hypothetical protein n=1 Tax=Novosphingobium sp. MMS21-SN21R TaxID=2969298 RepID=UPI002888DE4B|nr:hypothetical protein [Novosphingobium sp. MMS21-SN21R]MDT0508388.1 hypothetical protein [Novosphingobium sp. MMS21-SN21R]